MEQTVTYTNRMLLQIGRAVIQNAIDADRVTNVTLTKEVADGVSTVKICLYADSNEDDKPFEVHTGSTTTVDFD